MRSHIRTSALAAVACLGLVGFVGCAEDNDALVAEGAPEGAPAGKTAVDPEQKGMDQSAYYERMQKNKPAIPKGYPVAGASGGGGRRKAR